MNNKSIYYIYHDVAFLPLNQRLERIKTNLHG
jgi:hypothetical protein